MTGTALHLCDDGNDDDRQLRSARTTTRSAPAQNLLANLIDSGGETFLRPHLVNQQSNRVLDGRGDLHADVPFRIGRLLRHERLAAVGSKVAFLPCHKSACDRSLFPPTSASSSCPGCGPTASAATAAREAAASTVAAAPEATASMTLATNTDDNNAETKKRRNKRKRNNGINTRRNKRNK